MFLAFLLFACFATIYNVGLRLLQTRYSGTELGAALAYIH